MMSVLVDAPDSTGKRMMDSVLPAHAGVDLRKKLDLMSRGEPRREGLCLAYPPSPPHERILSGLALPRSS